MLMRSRTWHYTKSELVRMRALGVLQQLQPKDLCKHVEEIKNMALKDESEEVRVRALDIFKRLFAEDASKHSDYITSVALHDESEEVCLRALGVFLGLPAKDKSQHAEEIKKIALNHKNEHVCSRALGVLTKLSAEELSAHADKINNEALHNESEQVRLNALNVFRRLQSQDVVKHAQDIRHMALNDESGRARLRALGVLLKKLPLEDLSKHAQEIIKKARHDESEAVRLRALKVIVKSSGKELCKKHAEEIKSMVIHDKSEKVRLKALEVFLRLPELELSRHAEEIKSMILREESGRMRLLALKVFMRLPEKEVSKHAKEIKKMALDDGSEQVRQRALRVLLKLPVKELKKYVKEIENMALSDEKHRILNLSVKLSLSLQCGYKPVLPRDHAGMIMMMIKTMGVLPVALWRKIPESMSTFAVEGGLTLLHVAAESNNLPLCHALVERAGVPVRPRDDQGREPYQLTTSRRVDIYLRSKICIAETRFGSGDALRQARRDSSMVRRLTWYTIPLPKIAGAIGGKHSFLHITTQNSTSSNSYILEKAQPNPGGDDGTFVGYWQDVDGIGIGANLAGEARIFRQIELEKDVTMEDLIKVSQEAGPYRLSTCNCHHVARHVFNYCCMDKSQKVSLWSPPNWLLARLFGGVISARSKSSSFGATSASGSEGSAHGPADASLLDGFHTKFDAKEGVYTCKAAYLSSVVYDDKLIQSNQQMPEVQPGHIRVCNRIKKTVTLQRRDTSEEEVL